MSGVKSFEQLAESAYAAAAKQHEALDEISASGGAEREGPMAPWTEIGDWEQSCWVAAAKQLWAEFAAIH